MFPFVAFKLSPFLPNVKGTPIVFVSLDYRLGSLGFPTGSEAQTDGLLNLGLKDQLAALEWVHANINAFGGDNTQASDFGIKYQM